MSGWFRALFLVSSFGPLYGVVAAGLFVQRAKVDGWWFFALWCAASVLIFLWLQRDFKSKSPVHMKAKVTSALDESILTYIVAYLPPLLVDDFSKLENTIPALLFYVILVTLMARAETIYVNPFFLWFGYRVYRMELETGRSVIVITRKQEVIGGERLNLYEIQASRFYYAS